MANDKFLFVVSGAAGTGKDSVVKALREAHPEIEKTVSATTRAPRPGEQEGVDYYYRTREQFQQLLENDQVVEHNFYNGNYYGTLKSEVEKRLEAGKVVVLVIDVHGAANIRRMFPGATTVFLLPPSVEELEHRLRGRGTETEESIQERLATARQELGNPVLVVDSSFRTLAMEPEQPIGIDSWDRILQGEAPQRHDLKQAEAIIENFSAHNLTGLQTVPYTEPDGRPVRRMVGPVVAPDDGRNCGGLEIIELEHPFAPEDEVLAQRLLELLQHYLVHVAPTAWRAAPEERFLQELLFCEPAQQSAMQKKLHRFPALEAPPHFYLASIPLSQAHRLTRTNQQALLAHEWPEGWFMQTETAFLLLLPGTGDAAQPEQLLQKLQEVGLRMDQTVILSMPFPSLLQLGTVWRFNQEAAATARDLHCGAGCRSASALYQDVFVRTIAQSANLRAFIHPMLRRLQEYDQAHSTALLHTLCVYLLQEQNLHATARQLFIHRNTLVYRLQRIRTLLQLDLDDAAVRNVLRTGCILLEYYQGAF